MEHTTFILNVKGNYMPNNILTELSSDSSIRSELDKVKNFLINVDLSDNYSEIRDRIPESFAKAAKYFIEGREDELLLELANLDFSQAELLLGAAQTQLEFWEEAKDAAEAIGRIALRLILSSMLA